MQRRPDGPTSQNARVKELQDALLGRTVARFRLQEVDAEVRALRAMGHVVPLRVEDERRHLADALAEAEARIAEVLRQVAAGRGAFPL
ncbi:MAG TPA: hypothetical protein VNX21_02150 [Candidatus Thermoplasmatota archaeon]|nr:hypothetical protein [Candidatus Thermoplasmatota archaeon]